MEKIQSFTGLITWKAEQTVIASKLINLLLFLVLTAFYLILTPSPAFAVTKTWAGGASGEWNSSGNWSPSGIPSSSDDVTIDNAAVTATTTSINFSTLTIGSGTNTSSLTLTTNIGTGGSITINNTGTLTQNNKVQQTITGTLTINSGGNLTHTANTTTNLYNVNFSAATITVTGTINVNGKGYYSLTGNNGSGSGGGRTGNGNSGGGGAHGGVGGTGFYTNSTGGTSYGSVTDPQDLGSGGGGDGYGAGGYGGGVIILNISNTLTVNGSIAANGSVSTSGISSQGGGAGGSINITVGTIAGTGGITVNGGNQYSTASGGGSGGRIAIYYNTDSFSSGTLSAYGGSGLSYGGTANIGYGGPGTIYKATQAGANRTLIIDNNSNDSANNGAELDNYSIALDAIQLKNKGNLHIKSGSSMTVSANQINSSGGTSNGILSNDGTLTLPSTYTLDGYTLWTNATGTISGLTNLTIGSTGTLSHGVNTTAKTYYINLSLTTLTINSGGTVNVSNKGYAGGLSGLAGNGPGKGIANTTGNGVGGGGGHGGAGGIGGASSALGGGSNDPLTNPIDLGSGGAGSNYGSGGFGGGSVTLTVAGTFDLSGSITANGASPASPVVGQGGGAGGTINITSGTFTGIGSITANGSNAITNGGGGSGGRVSITATSNTYTGTAAATGGTGYQSGLDGSIYFGSPTFSNVTVTANTNASATISGVKTIAFWVKPTASTARMIQLASGVNISSTDGTLSSSGITSPTYYVNGIPGGTTIAANQWNHVVVTTSASSGITANSILLGQMSAGYLGGQLDDVRLYTSEYSSGQVSTLYSDSNTLANLTLSTASEQAGAAPLVYWKFDEGTGTTTSDSSGNGITATLAGNTIPTWQTENNCSSGKCLYLDGLSSKLTISSVNNVSSIKSVGIWVKPTSVTSLALIDLDGGTHKVTVSSGTISATGFSSPTIYVNGKASTTLAASSWQFVEVTTTTGFNPTTALTLGNSASTYLTGYLDEVKLYNYTRSANQVLTDYAGKKAPIGASMIITPASYSSGQAPIGHWRLDENTGSSAYDSSTSGATGTISGASWKVGKYGPSLSFDGTDDNVTVATALSAVKTVEFWVNPATTTQYFIDLDGGTHYISASSGTVSATGFGGTVTIYVNGVVSGTVTANTWNHVAVTNTTSFNSTSSMTFGKSGSNYLNGKLDDLRIYNYVRTQKQVISDMMGDGARSPVMASQGSTGGSGRAGGPVGYYKFDEGYSTTANDSSGNSNSLTLSSASWTLGGKFNKAFNGTGSIWVSRADDSDFDIAATDDYSISFWFKSDSAANPSAVEYLVNKANATTAGYAIYANTSGNICIGIDDDTTWNPDISSCSPDDIYDNTWHHITAVRDNSSTDKTVLYVDGVLKDTDTDSTTATLANALSLYIGDRDGTDNGDEFNGDIDDVKFYRYILTASEVKLDYNRGASLVLGALSDKTGTGYESNQNANQEYCIPGDSTSCAAPVGRWDFEENTGNTVNDKSGNNNTGTWQGTLGNQWKPGKNSPGGNFNGSDNRVVSDSNITGISANFDATISVWVKFNDVNSGWHAIADFINSTNDEGFAIFQGPDGNGSLAVSFYNSRRGYTTTGTVTTGQWYHLVATKTAGAIGSSTTKLYVNGIPKSLTFNSSSTPNFNGGKIYIGSDNANEYSNSAIIDHVRVYNYARSAAQIAWDYNRGAPVAHYKMDECQGTTIHNSSENSNHGTISLSTTGTQTTALGMGTCTTNASTPWYNGRTGKFNSSLNFDGTNDYVGSIPSISNIQSVSFWVKPSSSTASMLALTASAYITSSSGTVSATGFTLPSVYVNGILGGTLTGAAWNHIVVTTGTGITGSAVSLGLANGTYLNGQIDNVKIFNYPLTAKQVQLEYNQGGAIRYGPAFGPP